MLKLLRIAGVLVVLTGCGGNSSGASGGGSASSGGGSASSGGGSASSGGGSASSGGGSASSGGGSASSGGGSASSGGGSASSGGGSASSGGGSASSGGGSASSGGGSASHGVPTGFDQLAAPSNNPTLMAVDGNNRLFVGDGVTVNFIDDGANSWTAASPSGDGVFISAPITGMSVSPGGNAVWAASGKYLLRRGLGTTTWATFDGGVPGAGAFNPPGFDSAGNGFMAVNTQGATTAQLYRLQAGSSVWAPYGPLASTRLAGAPIVTADGTVYISATINDLMRLDDAGTAYAAVSGNLVGQLALGKDDTAYVLTGAGTQAKVYASDAGTGVFTLAQSVAGANGSSDLGGLCVHPSGDIYVLAGQATTGVSGVWRRSTSGVWEQLVLNPMPAGKAIAIACAPNGRIYTIWGSPVNNPKVYRSKP